MKWKWILIGIAALCYWMIYRARRRNDYHTLALDEALRQMKTGDLILFSGRNIPKGPLDQMARRALFLGATYLYRAADACEWGHVGVVYKDDITGHVSLVHCEMSSTLPDLLSGVPVTGVQKTDLVEKIRRYQGYCLWRPLNKAIPNDVVCEFLKRTYHMGYSIPSDILCRLKDRLLPSFVNLSGAPQSPPSFSLEARLARRNDQGVLCTEWVGALLEFCGVFDSGASPTLGYYLPSDFTAKRSMRYCQQKMREEWRYCGEGYELHLD